MLIWKCHLHPFLPPVPHHGGRPLWRITARAGILGQGKSEHWTERMMMMLMAVLFVIVAAYSARTIEVRA